MPGNYDSSINIDSRINTDGVKKGVQEIKDEIRSLEEEVTKASESMASAGELDTTDSQKSLEELGAVAEETSQKVDDAFAVLAEANGIDELGAKAEEAAQRVEDAFSILSEANGLDLSAAENSLDGFAEKAAEAGKEAEEAGGSKIVVDTDVDEGTFTNDIASMQAAVQSLEQSFLQLGQVIQDIVNSVGVMGQQTAAAEQAAGDAANGETVSKFTMLKNAIMGAGEALRNLPQNAQIAYNSLMLMPSETILGGMAKLGGAIATIGTKAFGAARSLAGMAKGPIISGLKGIASHAKSAASSIAAMAKNSIISGLNKLKGAISGVSKNSGDTTKSFKKGLMMVLRYGLGIRGLFQLFRKLRSAISEGLNNVATYDTQFKATMDDFKAALTTLKNAVGAAVAPIAQIVLPVITKLIYSITEGINHFGQLTAALTGAKTYLKATKAQAGAYKQEAKAAKEAQKTIAGFDDLTILQENEEQDNGGGDQGSNPGFEMAPIENGIKGLADALKDMWNKADFTDLGRMLGERLRDALNSIPWDPIKKTLRKIGKSIATFLNGFLETPGLFDAIGRTLAQALNSAFEFLYAFVTNFHWDSLGRAIVEGLLGFFNNIDWSLIQATFAEFGKGIATTIGTVFSDPNLPLAIGNTLAQVINTAFLFLKNFVMTIPWGEIGTFIKNALMSLFSNINWDDIYTTLGVAGRGIATTLNNALNDPNLWAQIMQTFSNAIKAVFLFIYEFVTTMKWMEIGQSMGQGVNEGTANFPWFGIGRTIGLALSAIPQWLYGFIKTIDWKSIGNGIGNSISGAINNFDWNTAGASVGALIQSLFNLLLGIVQTTDFKALGRGVVDMIAGFFGEFDWASVGELVSSLIIGLFNFLSGAIQQVDWSAVPGQIVKIISDFMSGIDWGAAAEAAMGLLGSALGAAFKVVVGLLVMAGGAINEAFKNIAEGGLEGIIAGLANIGQWIMDHVFTPFINAFKSAFGIASPSKEMESMGGFIVEGLLNGILAPLTDILTWLNDHVASPIINGVCKLFGIDTGKTALENPGSLVTDGLKNGISGAMAGIQNFIKGTVTDPVESAVENGLGTSGTPVTDADGKAIVNGLKSGIGTGANGMGQYVSSTVTDPVLSGIRSPFGINGNGGDARQFADYGRSAMDGLKSGIAGGTNAVIGEMTNIAKKLLEALKQIDWPKIGAFIPESISKGIKGGAKAVIESAAEIAKGLGTLFKDVNWSTLGELVSEGISKGIIGRAKAVIESATNVAKGLIDLFKNVDWSKLGELLTEGISKGIIGGARKVVDSASEIAKGIGTLFKDVNWPNLGEFVTEGISKGIGTNKNAVFTAVSDIASEISGQFEKINWFDIGDYICGGIQRGMQYGWGNLAQTAWNMAVDLFNTACNALGIASPSKKFYWIASMMTEGIVGGLEDTAGDAVDAVAATTDAVTREAESAMPTISIDTALDGSLEQLDTTMLSFADRVVGGFEAMVNALTDIASKAAFAIPQAAMGSIAPYAARAAAAKDDKAPDMETIMELISAQNADRLTREDLLEVLTAVAREYFNVELYLGDEQVARSANRGNVRLNRRFSTIN